jgi:4-hydroxy-4-methyl-2-oxoglutarate aldolase
VFGGPWSYEDDPTGEATGADKQFLDEVLFMPATDAAEIVTFAETIRDTERRQEERICGGLSLRGQVQFDRCLAERQRTPSLSFSRSSATCGWGH